MLFLEKEIGLVFFIFETETVREDRREKEGDRGKREVVEEREEERKE